MDKLLAIIFCIACSCLSNAQNISVIPEPVSAAIQKGVYNINNKTVIIAKSSEEKKSANFLNNYLKKYYGFTLMVQSTGTSGIILSTTNAGKDSYTLQSNSRAIQIKGNSPAGTFYGIQTLIQLLPPTKSNTLQVACVNISDAPATSYRGLMLDVSRYFFSVDYVKQVIDYMAMYKLNNFHWHLTDDQGWRIEIKKYPKLTQVGAWRNGTIIGRYPGKGNDNKRYGGYYTQEEIKEVIKYANDRYINVIPEIELPGHASAAIAAYPQLSCFPDEPTIKYFNKDCTWAGDSTGKQVQQTWGVIDDVFDPSKEFTFTFLKDVLDEVIALFPSKYIHIGGDECPKTNWKRSAAVQALMKEKGLKDEHEVQSYFIKRIEKHINSRGRSIIGWDEILEGGLAPNATVMSWRGEEGGIEAAKSRHDVIMTPTSHFYFDYSQTRYEDSVTIGGYLPIEKVYSYSITPKELPAEFHKYIKGAQANLWTEYISNPRKVEYHLFPRLAALSEVVWSKPELKNWEKFEQKLNRELNRYDFTHVNYSKALFALSNKVTPANTAGKVLWELNSKDKSATLKYRKQGDANWVTYLKPLEITASGVYEATQERGGQMEKNIQQQNFNFSKSTSAKIALQQAPSNSYAGDGGFTLVNGVINTVGLKNSSQFLGFDKGDCVATLDLGKPTSFDKIVVNTIESTGSWIYAPTGVTVEISDDGVNYKPWGTASPFEKTIDNGKGNITVNGGSTTAKYIKVTVKSLGKIPDTQPGGGHHAWLFVDEIAIY